MLTQILRAYLRGIVAAFGASDYATFLRLLQFFRNDVIYQRFWQCVLVNGVIFLGSLGWLHLFVLPVACSILQVRFQLSHSSALCGVECTVTVSPC